MLGGTESVIVISPAVAVDPYAATSTAEDWDNATRRRLRDCVVLPDEGAESTAREQQEIERITVRSPGLPRVRATDRLAWRGQEYRVVKPPLRWRVGTPHTVITAERVTG